MTYLYVSYIFFFSSSFFFQEWLTFTLALFVVNKEEKVSLIKEWQDF